MAAFIAIALVICSVGMKAEGREPSWWIWVPTGLLAVIIGLVVGWTSPRRNEASAAPPVTERARDVDFTPELLHRAAHPYRTRIARAARRVLPLSGWWTAIAMAGAFAVSAVALPVALRLPRWVEAEIVLAAWWVCIAGLLTALLFRGWRLADDHRLRIAATGVDDAATPQRSPDPSARGWLEAGSGCADLGTGCGEGIVVALALVLAAGLAWVLVEIVVPIAFFGIYWFVVRAVGRATRDRRGCEGRLARSVLWGAAYATAYVAPVAALVWGLTLVLRWRAL